MLGQRGFGTTLEHRVTISEETGRFRGALAPLNNPSYRLLLSGFAIGQMIMPLQFITQILWVQHFAPVDIWLVLVAMIAACRDRKSTRLNSSHSQQSRMPSSA